MATIKALIKNGDRLVDMEAFIGGIPGDGHTVHSLNTHRQEMTRLWEAFRDCYEEILDNEEESKLIEQIKAKYLSTYTTYFRTISYIDSVVDKISKKTSNTSIPINLPPCDTDIFSGDYSSWPTFRDMFSALYRNNNHISNIQKMYYLLQKTQGEARDIIRTCPITNEGFDMAWHNLVDRYENKRVLVNAQLKNLFNLASIDKESGPSIKCLQRTINDCITNLSLLGIETSNWDIIFVFICSTRLPEITLGLWEQTQGNISDLPKWDSMDKFLTARYQTLESVSDIRGALKPASSNNNQTQNSNSKRNFNENRRYKSFSTSVTPNLPPRKCFLCPESHPLRLCSSFLRMTVSERETIVKRHKCCTNCLGTSHEFRKCRSSNVCYICKKKHHSLLHRSDSSNRTTLSVNPPNSENANPPDNHTRNNTQPRVDDDPTTSAAARSLQNFATCIQSTPYSTVLLGTTVADVCINDVRCSARALIDPASQATFISRKLQRKLSLPCLSAPSAEIVGLNGAVAAKSTKVCVITLQSSIEPNFELKTEAYVVEKLTGRLPTYSLSKFLDSNLPEIPTDLKCSHMDLLLGGDIYSKIMLTDVQKHPSGDLIAQRSVFGWIITGKVPQYQPLHSVVSFYNHLDLNAQIARFWELEEIPKSYRLSDEDTYCENLYRNTTYRNSKGRYVVSLPFRTEFPENLQLGFSRNVALSQFYRNETRLLKTPDIKTQYDQVIEEYSSLGHMVKVSPEKSSTPNSTYYLPHHAVFKPDSATTKLRVVFNASNPSSNGVSLNHLLHTGPVLQSDLTILMLRWRLFCYVFNADIEKMYRQILVNPDHASFQRILFRKNPLEEVEDFELNTVTFGVNCAPYLAIRTLHQLAEDCESSYPAASKILRNQMYVDDVLAGSHTLEEAIRNRNELIEVLNSAGFALRKWTANNQSLVDNIPTEHLLDSEFLRLSDASTTKTLGLRWNAGNDSFFFKPALTPDCSNVTKRVVLSQIAKLFDPAGWLAPKIVAAKILMQQIWKDKTDWDECLKPTTLNKWLAFVDDYPYIEKINIPRWVNFNPQCEVQLHAFCDASEKAYAAALYTRVQTHSGEIITHLLAAKSKVAPIKVESLPRLELCGATLLARMVNSLRSELNLTMSEAICWTDSTIVLSWLQKPPCQWPTFVANRVSLILDKVGTDNWNHVNSQDNPADLATRGISARDLVECDIWWKGPQWLRCPQSEWPKSSNRIASHHVHIHAMETTSISESVLREFSDLPRALRVLAFAFRFIHNTHPRYKSSRPALTPELSRDELNFVKGRLIVICQRTHFPEYSVLNQGAKLSQQSSLLTFNPFIDSNGFMRMNGRLSQSPALTYDERFPKLLPYAGYFTLIYLEFIHKYSVHGENSLMIRLMRHEFWVPRLTERVRAVIRNCNICVLYKKRQSRQIMAALPPERTMLSRPFTHTGLDYAGPFEIKSYAGRGCRMTKGYVLVFVCFATKAIHLEATSDITTVCFIAAFDRFISRRGCPSDLYSDNGTSFGGAARVFKRSKNQFLLDVKKKMVSKNAFQSLEWHFIPPVAPHMGGLWEAGVKSFKTHLKKISHSQKFTFEEFSTMLCRIEACLNSRPLSPMTNNPSDLNPLTPGHFLNGSAILSPPEPDLSNESLSYVNRWQKLKVLHHYFARRWKHEYLVELHKRNKWRYPERNYAVGDLVVIRQDNLPPTEWKLGRVDNVYVGSDSKVRVVDVRTATGILKRPIVKLVLLPNPEQN